MIFNNLSTENGLSNNKIRDVIQDKTGFIWLATEDGLNRFDGYEFKVYRHIPGDTNSLSDNNLWTLYEDIEGYIWIGTKSGEINRYDPYSDKFTHLKIKSEIVKENSITSIHIDRKGAVWIGTYSSGLYRVDKTINQIENWVNTPQNPHILTNGYITSISEDSDGNILAGTYVGLSIVNYSKNNVQIEKIYFDSTSLKTSIKNIIWSITKSESEKDLFWIGTADGLVSFNSDNRKYSRIEILNPQKLQFGTAAGNIIEDFEGKAKIIWIDSYEGLLKANLSTGEQIRFLENKEKPNHLVNNQINKIIRDRSGVIWIATENGLSYVTPYSLRFNSFTNQSYSKFSPPEFRDKDINSISRIENKLYIGTTKGLYVAENVKDRILIKIVEGTYNLNIWSLASDINNNLWVGTYGSGLFLLNNSENSFRKILLSHPLLRTESKNFIKTLYPDNENNLWIGFWGVGLGKLNITTKELTVWQNQRDRQKNEISHNDVWAIYIDRNNRKWIGTNGGGLNLLVDENSGKFINWVTDDSKNSISSNNIYCIIESPTETESKENLNTVLWIGTSGGLNKIEIEQRTDKSSIDNLQTKFTAFNIKDGLPDNSIHSIIEDDNKNLWLASNSGISFFNTKSKQFVSFNKSHGLNSISFNTNAVFRESDGKLLFGGKNGLNFFYPEQIVLSKYIPKLVITKFLIFNEPVNAGNNSPLNKNIFFTDSISLSYNQNVFSFEFAALDFNSPNSIHYAYMMEGFDKDWIYSGTRRFVTYTNLNAGKYTFKVRSTNADGIWVDNTANLAVIIRSPWWATGWAYFSYIFVIFIGLYAIRKFELNRQRLKNIIKMREFETKKQKELDEMKTRFFANLSHEFRTPLMLIKGPLEQLMEDKSDGKHLHRYQMIHRNTQNLQLLIDQLLELSQLESAAIPVKAKQEDVIITLKGLVYSFDSLAQNKNINLSFSCSDDSIIAWIDKDKLEKIINNLLSNAFKFTSENGRIDINVEKIWCDSKEYIKIKVADTGIGIPKSKLEKIFDRFYQVDDSSQRAYGGSGIGLALVKELVELHRLEISVDSEFRKGTEFILKIPLWDYLDENQKLKSENILTSELIVTKSHSLTESQQTNAEEIIDDEETNSIIINDLPSILIVEDSEDVRFYLYDLLKSKYTIYQASNGKEGISIAKEKMPDLIISDVMMPEMDGMKFCKKIKTDWLTSHIPVILLTAKATSESKIEGLETGADDYLTKPFSSRELFIRIKNLLDLRKKLRERFSKDANIKPEVPALNPLDEEFVQKAFSIVEKNLDNVEFDNEAFANEMFLSRMQLHRKLQAVTGQTPGDFIRTFRLKKAAQMLKERKLSITQIAFEVGYNSPSQFTRAFTKHFNCTPSEYLNK